MFKFSDHIEINNYIFKLVNSQQLLYKPIYILEPIELATLKAYIKTNLANGFVRPFKLLVSIPIFFG